MGSVIRSVYENIVLPNEKAKVEIQRIKERSKI